jgi:hypothetical protein
MMKKQSFCMLIRGEKNHPSQQSSKEKGEIPPPKIPQKQ